LVALVLTMTRAMHNCADEIRSCWQACDAALRNGDSDGANDAFGRVFEVVDTFPALAEDDARALNFLCVLTWVKVATALDLSGQPAPASEARRQAFTLLDETFAIPGSLDFLRGLESEESTDLVGRLYLACSQAGRRDTILWGRCFHELDTRLHGEPGAAQRIN
jgi:hypothetical protein